MDSERFLSPKALALLAAIFGSFILLIFLPSFPSLSPPGLDSGVFLYTGTQLIEGKIPYGDLWDHKGPVIYFIDALGIFLAAGSLWGVALLQLASLTTASLLSFLALQRFFGSASALIATSMWIVTLPAVVEGGNFTETWNLLFQFGTLSILAVLPGASTPKHSRKAYLLASAIGVLGALAFFSRPNLISLWVVLAVVTAVRAITSGRSDYHTRLALSAVAGATIIVVLI